VDLDERAVVVRATRQRVIREDEAAREEAAGV
jgi:hypothetical protein